MNGIPGEPIYKSAEMVYLCTRCKKYQFFFLSGHTKYKDKKYDTIEKK